MVQGVVREWHEDDGWGVVDSPETPGGCWAHFSAIESRVVEGAGGYIAREYAFVAPGDAVELVWEQFAQDGFEYRAVSLTPAPQPA